MRGYVTVMAINTVSMHRHHMTVMTILMHFLLHLDLQAVFHLDSFKKELMILR